MIGRRSFIAAIAALGASRLARAQGKVRRVAILLGSAADQYGRAQIDALREGLKRAGWEEGRNLELIVRLADGKVEAMRAGLREIVATRPEVIAVSTATALRETRHAAGTIPIVFWGVSDPVGAGLGQGAEADVGHPLAHLDVAGSDGGRVAGGHHRSLGRDHPDGTHRPIGRRSGPRLRRRRLAAPGAGFRECRRRSRSAPARPSRRRSWS